MTDPKARLLSQIDLLSEEDQQWLHRHLNHGTQAAGSQIDTNRDQTFWELLQLRQRAIRGFSLPPYSRLSKDQKGLWAVTCSDLFAHKVQDLNRAQKLRFCTICAEVMVEGMGTHFPKLYAGRRYLQGLLTNAVAFVERAFPSYRQSGLLHLIAPGGNNVRNQPTTQSRPRRLSPPARARNIPHRPG